MNGRSLLLSSVFLLLMATPALADVPHVSPATGVVVGLLTEVAVLIVLMAPRRFDVVPLALCWFGITVASWAIFVFGFYVLRSALDPDAGDAWRGWTMVSVEIAIVAVEGFVLRLLSSRRAFQRRGAIPLSLPRALAYSLTVNVVSIAVGILAASVL